MQTATDTTTITRITRAEAPALAQRAYADLLDLLRNLDPDDWTCQTDCPDWDVREMAIHVLGACESCASKRELAHQFLAGKKWAKANDRPDIDGINAVQVADRQHLSPDEVLAALAEGMPKAVKARRKTPGFARRMDIGDGSGGPMKLGWLMDVIYTRDTWMHRVDVARATGRMEQLTFTAEHDGRLVADVVAQWASEHGKPFDLVLDGLAGGHFRQGSGTSGEALHLDAVDFMRIVSGREQGEGLLAHTVLF